MSGVLAIPKAPRVDRIVLGAGQLAPVWSQASDSYTTYSPTIRLGESGSSDATAFLAIPAHWNSMTIKALWVCETAGVGTVQLNYRYREITGGTILDVGAAGPAQTPLTPATALTVVETNLGTRAVTGGSMARVGVRREPTSGGDTETALIHILALILERAT